MKRLFSLFIAIWLVNIMAMAASDTNCKGTVIDNEGEPIIGATVAITNGRTVGVTDVDGAFSVKVPSNAKTLTITFIGYKPLIVNVASNIGTVKMDMEAHVLNDVVVTQSLARTRETPVALSQINASEIEYKIGNQEFPEVLKTTPGVWTTKDGGGFGDAKTNMRGFQSANVAVLVNGIPINDMEWGGVYWSNWAGLSDVASNIQTQRGLGAALLSAPSVGGTINITTRSLDAERGGSVWYGMGNDGMNNYGVKLSTGLMDNGWAVTLLGSHKWGDGYIQGTWFDSYNYFINVSKRINDAHQLSFTAFGAPQKHNKRSSQDGLTIEGYQTYAREVMNGESPYRYNPTFGYDKQGQRRSSNLNTYHKPQISLAHIWQINDKSSLSTTAYVSFATGGGYSGQGRGTYNGQSLSNTSWYGASDGQVNTLFRNAGGTFGYNLIREMNEQSETGSNMVMASSNNSHEWYGLVSTYKNQFFNKKLTFTAGIDVRYYIGHHNNKIIDLYNGEYYVDDSSRKKVLAANNYRRNDPEWVYEKLGVGDVVYRDYDGHTHQEGAYIQGEMSLLDKRLNLVLSGSLSNTGYQRIDHFYYDKEHEKSPTHNFMGGTVKAGANYNFDRHNNVFFNVGYISRAPFFSRGVFLSSNVSNTANPNPMNEKIASFEVGYGYHSQVFSANVNAYYTKWYDKTTTRSGNLSGERRDEYYSFNMSGVDARHMGIEVNFIYIPVKWFELEGMLSLGDYEWASNAVGYFYDQNGFPLANLNGSLASGVLADDHLKATLEQKGVKVGGTAQTTGSLSATFRPFKGWRIGADWIMNANNYSDYQVKDSNINPGSDISVAKPWRIPWGNQLDLSASYSFKIGGIDARLTGNVYNVFNYNYVVDAWTNTGERGTWDNAFRLFYSFGHTYSMKLRINF